uniref:protein FAM169B isoform X2 n=1 Tax=Gasterosteus aculeatus aculeatus TaxID=481459 RepID=UPI001A982551|nr:protein FAM169B isoform X2 [Gasterosteus aculeatus aculeatus]
MYPVDLPAARDADLTSASEEYLSSLQSRPHQNQWFPLSHSTKVAISAKSVRRLQLFEDDDGGGVCTLLALHAPDDATRAVALYLHGRWWHVDDVLRTSSDSRVGLISLAAGSRRRSSSQAQSLTERVVVFLLSRVVERSRRDEVAFSLHPRTESCKVLWRDGQAVGFYTIKHKGSLCDGGGGSSRGYLLPVLDTVLVRRSWRRRGLGLHMLTDFCASFAAEPFLGVSSPLSPGMVAVCRSFLQKHQERLEQLYEVEAPGGWTQRRNIWLGIKLGRYSLGVGEESTMTSGETSRRGDDSSQKPTACPVSAHPAEGPSVRQIKRCDPSSPSGERSGTACSPAAHAEDPDSGPPTRPPPQRREEPGEETQSRAKRGRRT